MVRSKKKDSYQGIASAMPPSVVRRKRLQPLTLASPKPAAEADALNLRWYGMPEDMP
jgi:hypothetical protein